MRRSRPPPELGRAARRWRRARRWRSAVALWASRATRPARRRIGEALAKPVAAARWRDGLAARRAERRGGARRPRLSARPGREDLRGLGDPRTAHAPRAGLFHGGSGTPRRDHAAGPARRDGRRHGRARRRSRPADADHSSQGGDRRRLHASVTPLLAEPAPPGDARSGRELAHLSDEALLALVARRRRGMRSASSTTASAGSPTASRCGSCATRALAEDAVQEAFLAVWRSAGSFLAERGEGEHLDPDARPPARRRPRPPRGAPARRAARRARRAARRQATDEEAWLARASGRSSRRRCAQLPRRAARGDRARLLRRPHPVASSPSGSASRSARSRAGCSPACSGCASCSPRPGSTIDATVSSRP